MRSFVSEPMRYGRLFLPAMPPTSCRRPGQGTEPGLADVAVLADALSELVAGARSCRRLLGALPRARLALDPLLVGG